MSLCLRKKGQSLVEMALIAPVLIVMFLGVVEVGYAIRSYLILLNANREAARFVARGLYTDDQAYVHLMASASPLILDIENSTIYVHRFQMKAGDPFDPGDDFYTNTLSAYGYLRPSILDIPEFAAEALALNDQVNVTVFERELSIACESIEPDPARCQALGDHDFVAAPVSWTVEDFVYVEVFYEHEQLLGFFRQWRIPMYTHTMMRINRPRG